jgi:hypothetical protein
MDRIDPIEDRDLQPAHEGPRLALVVRRGPPRRRDVGRVRPAAAEHRPDREPGDVGLVLQRQQVDLGHLADPLVERHGGQQGLDPGLGLGIAAARLRIGLATPRGIGPRARRGDEEHAAERMEMSLHRGLILSGASGWGSDPGPRGGSPGRWPRRTKTALAPKCRR